MLLTILRFPLRGVPKPFLWRDSRHIFHGGVATPLRGALRCEGVMRREKGREERAKGKREEKEKKVKVHFYIRKGGGIWALGSPPRQGDFGFGTPLL